MTRPVLLFCCHPLTGHVTPVLRIAAGLRQRGWRVAFLSSDFFRPRIEAAGLQFLPLQGAAALDDATLFDRAGPPLAAGFATADAVRLPPSITDNRHQALFALPAEWASLAAALTTVAAQLDSEGDSSRVLVVSEAFYYGAMPLKHGASLPATVVARLVPRSVCISITAPAIRSVDLPPFGHAAPFDRTPAGRARLAAIWDTWLDDAAPVTAVLRCKMREATGTAPEADDGGMVFMGGANYVCHNVIAQVGVPAFEFPRTDFPSGFRIVGVVPPAPPAQPPSFAWWSDVVGAAARGIKVVVVAQGTVETAPTDLILPTLRICGDGDDDNDSGDRILAVAVLGVRGATLDDADGTLPPNARVADYLAYDAVLPYADLWVHNGGYGATMHGIAHGVPMVIAGDTQDKPESAKRVHHSGLGIDLATARPAVPALRSAIRTVLADPKFAAAAHAMQATAARMDCVGNVEALIQEQSDAVGHARLGVANTD